MINLILYDFPERVSLSIKFSQQNDESGSVSVPEKKKMKKEGPPWFEHGTLRSRDSRCSNRESRCNRMLYH